MCCLKSVIFCTQAVCFSHLLTRRQPQANGIDMSWFYSYKHPRRNVNIWLLLTVKAKRRFLASLLACVLLVFVYRLCVSAMICWQSSYHSSAVEICTTHRTKNLHLFVFIQSCCVSLSLSVCLNPSPSHSFSLHLVFSLCTHLVYRIFMNENNELTSLFNTMAYWKIGWEAVAAAVAAAVT